MQVTCRRQDQSRFEALGFQLDFEQNAQTPVIEMTDEEANYAHQGRLPADVPFLAAHGPAGNYGDGFVACDGKRYADVEAGHDGGFVVRWNEAKDEPDRSSLAAIRTYRAVRKRVLAQFKQLAAPSA
ncbi:MAG: hypothetical protein ABMA26_23525 [Limisphaerales bacterium]